MILQLNFSEQVFASDGVCLRSWPFFGRILSASFADLEGAVRLSSAAAVGLSRGDCPRCGGWSLAWQEPHLSLLEATWREVFAFINLFLDIIEEDEWILKIIKLNIEIRIVLVTLPSRALVSRYIVVNVMCLIS